METNAMIDVQRSGQRLAWWVAVLACSLRITTAGAQDVVADFSAAPPSGRYAFASTTPKAFPDLLKGTADADKVNIVGHLFLPGGSERVPAVIMMHGSGGIYSAMLDFWPKQLNGAGYAVLAVDSFGPRGVQSTAEDQSQVPFAADVADAYAALRVLATHPRIDPARIAIMGFSRGGITAWRSAIERVIAAQALPGGLRFAAHIPVYSGGCTGLFRLRVKPGVFSKAPMLWIHGTADDYTPIGPCKDYSARIAAAGTPVAFVALDGAMHKFDQDDVRRFYVRGAVRGVESCVLETDIDTLQVFDRNTGQRLQGPAYQEAAKACGAIGANVEGNRNARDKAAQAVIAFLRTAFGR
jgi:dienelactone hydrolase